MPGGITEEQPQLLERVPVLLDLIGHGLAVSLSLHRQLFQCQGIAAVVIVGAGGLSREAVNGDTDEEASSGRVANVDDALAHLENIDIAVKAEPRLVLRDDEIGGGILGGLAGRPGRPARLLALRGVETLPALEEVVREVQAGVGLASELGRRFEGAALDLVDVRAVIAHQGTEGGLGKPGEHALADQLRHEVRLLRNPVLKGCPRCFHVRSPPLVAPLG